MLQAFAFISALATASGRYGFRPSGNSGNSSNISNLSSTWCVASFDGVCIPRPASAHFKVDLPARGAFVAARAPRAGFTSMASPVALASLRAPASRADWLIFAHDALAERVHRVRMASQHHSFPKKARYRSVSFSEQGEKTGFSPLRAGEPM